MTGLRDMPIRRKMTLILMLSAATALLLAAVAFSANYLLTMREGALRDLEALAEITSANTEAAVVFDDPRAVRETLGFLASHPHIEAAVVIDRAGGVLGSYLRADLEPGAARLEPHRHHPPGDLLRGHLDIFRPIVVDGERVGEVYLRTDLREQLGERLATYAGIVAAVLGLALLAAYGVGGMLQRTVTDPLLGLAATAQRISREQDYELRAAPAGGDEVGQLIASFNAMVGEIQVRDEQLRQHREQLEEMVAVRTAELEALNVRLRQARDSAEQTAEEMSYQAFHDALTGLPNRLMLNDRLQRALGDQGRDGQRVALLFLDLDRFKVINDSLGHAVGDALLAEMGRRLKSCVRHEDLVARFGGDEFMVLLTGVTEHEDAGRVAAKIIDALTEPLFCRGHELHVTTSIGITVCPDDAADSGALIRNADVAMYRAKAKGRNSYQFWTRDMEASSVNRLAMENRLRKALERGELELHYQPQLDLASGRIEGVEALLRWNDGELGPVPPSTFIPLAEETGLVIPLGEWVMAEACRQVRELHAAGFGHLTMAVNLSACQFKGGHMPDMVIAALAASGVNGAAFELEITESVFMQGSESNRRALEALRDMGVRFAIDDFGTGYSSLSYLRRFPVDTVKIDRSFVTHLPGEGGDASIASAIIAMAHSLGLTVVAEGVESRAQEDFLAAHGCDRVQGFLHSPAVPAARLWALLRESAAAAGAAGAAGGARS